VWRLPKERSKNKQAHIVPLSEAAIDILAAVPRIQSQGRFVFTLTGEKPVTGFPGAKRKLDAAMPDMPHWTIHDLRRTCASGMGRLGVAPHVIEACLNHRSGVISGIAATYNRHSYLSEQRGGLDAWARHVEGIVSGNPAGNVVELKRGA
jgi:integrase